MTFALVYAENGDFVADFDSEDAAVEALRGFVADHPSVSKEVGLMVFDDRGYPTDFVPASAFVAPSL